MNPRVAVVIPNWNGIEYIADCLDSLTRQTLSPDKIIVIDNASKDGSRELVNRKYRRVQVIEHEVNEGFSGGVNTGIRYAIDHDYDYVALLNMDAVVDTHWLEHLVATAEKSSETGIVTGKFLRMDGKHLDSTGDFLTTRGLPYPRGRNEVDKGQYDKKKDVFGGSGGASLYRISMLRKIGLFDEQFFAYFEDVDISFRAQLAGWKVLYEPKAKAFHHIGGASGRMGDFARFHSTKNFLLLYAKNMPLKLYIKYLPLFSLQFVRMFASSIARRKLHVFIKGVWAAIRLHRSTKMKRKFIQKSRTVSAKYIDGILIHNRPPKPPVIEDVL